MAKRSDFAQKLLDDLRLRKERMASASPSQRSNQSNHLPIDAYAYTNQTYRRSRNTNGNEIVSSRSDNSRTQMISSMNGSNREMSNQIIIPYENGVKMKRINLSVMGFLQQIKRRSDLDRQLATAPPPPPPTTTTTLSLVQINEISKGAQKLNHILSSSSSSSSCSNGLIMGTYSLQFAKELLQGAIDLEESLGMLVDLQITTPESQSHNQNRITLLEEEEDTDSNTDERKNMQLARLANSMQRPITVTNSSKEARRIKVSKKGISSSNSSSSSNNARIPNVIAKLMGLDNLPEDSTGNIQHKLEMTTSKNTTKMMMKNQKVVALTSRHEEEKDYAQKSLIRDHGHNHPNITTNIQQHKGKVKVEKGGGANDLLEQEMHRRSQVKYSSIQVTNKHILLSNQNKFQKNHLGTQKSYSYILSKNGPPRERRQLQVKEGSDVMAIITPKNSPQKKSSAINQSTMFKKSSSHCSGDKAINHTNNKKVKETINKKWGQISTAKGRYGIKTLKDDKNIVHNKLANKKIKKKVDQMLFGRNGKGNQYIPGLQEAGHEPSNVLNRAKQERFIEVDIAPINNIIISRDESHQEIQSHQNSTIELHFHGVKSVDTNLQNHVAPRAADGGFKIGEVELHKTNGVNHSKSQLEKKISKISTEQPLTNGENHLKWILVMSQLFINTAEALFRLNIPFSVLDGDRQECQDQGSKLILDCGYEVMKRKGIRHELKVHNFSKISNNSVNIRSLNDLVRQLNEDMEKLKFYGRKKRTHVDVEDYLPIMLEHDVYDIWPDIDCMWDFGWNDETFAFIEKYDVIRDTEKYILSVLLDEITKDCCMFSEY